MGAPIPPSESRRLAEEIADPARYPMNQAVALAKASAAQGSAIANYLGDVLRKEADRSDGGRKPAMLRVLGLLTALDAEHLIIPVKTQLAASPDTEIRSKVVLMAGRTTKNLPWIVRRLQDPNARVQANAVQALWGIDSAETREILSRALSSPTVRIAANAVVGLHRIGHADSIGRLFEMGEHPEEAYRVAARWAMGETGDPRFVPYLMNASKTDTGKCHGMVVRALTRLRRRIGAIEQAGQVELKTWGARMLPGGWRRIGLSCWRPSAHEDSIAVGIMDVVITEGSKPITAYAMKTWPYPDMLLVGCARPRVTSQADPYRLAIESGLMQCAKLKRKRDLWAGDRYLTASSDAPDASALNTETADPVLENHLRSNRGFLKDPEIIERVIPGPGVKVLSSRDMVSSIKKLMEILSRASGSRHLFVFLDPDGPFPAADLEGLAQNARERDIAIHGVAPGALKDCSAFEELSEASGGTFHRLPEEDPAGEIRRCYEALINRYQVTYAGPETAGGPVSAEIKLYCAQGFGSAVTELC